MKAITFLWFVLLCLATNSAEAQLIPLPCHCGTLDSMMIDTTGMTDSIYTYYPFEGRLYSKGGIWVRFDVNAIQLGYGEPDSTISVNWTMIDTSYSQIRSGFESIEYNYGNFVLNKLYPEDTVGSAAQEFVMVFDSLINMDLVMDSLNSLDNVRTSFRSFPKKITKLTNDPGLNPSLEYDQLVVGGPNMGYWRHFKLGHLWYIYKAHLPMAWEITTGRPSIVIADRDCWHYPSDYNINEIVDHPEYLRKTTPSGSGNFIHITPEYKGNGKFTSLDLGFSHGLGVLGMANAIGDNNIGGVGTCYGCSSIALDWDKDTQIPRLNEFDTDLDSDNEIVSPISVVNLSYASGRETASDWQKAIESGIVVVAASGNNILETNGNTGYYGIKGNYIRDGITITYPFEPKSISPANFTFALESNAPEKDYKIIAVGATQDGLSRDAECRASQWNPYWSGDEQFVYRFTFSPGIDKFNVSTDLSERKQAKQAAFMDLVAPVGRLLFAEDGVSDCGDQSDYAVGICDPFSTVKCSNWENTYDWKFVDNGWGTSYAAPQVAGICGLMLSVNPYLGVDLDLDDNGIIDNGESVQRTAYNLLTFPADKIIDNGSIYEIITEKKDAEGNLVEIRILKTREPVQPEYITYNSDHLKRSWAQRMGFGRVNAYRSVAHAISLKGNRVWNVSQTLFNGMTNPPTNENNEKLMHFGAYNDNNELVLEHGGEDLPGENYNNQGITWIDGVGTTLTVPSDGILAIDGLVKTHNPLDNNKIVTSGSGKILITGYLEDIEVVGNIRVDDLIVRGSVSDATGCIAIGMVNTTGEVYGNVQLKDYGVFNVNKGTLQMKPGSTIDMQGERDLVVKDGATLEMEHGSTITGLTNRQVVVESGCTLKVNNGVHADILSHVLVKDGGSLIIGEDAVVSVNRFTVERNGELIVNKGARLTLNERAENVVNGRLRVIGESSKRVTISGRTEECCTRFCTEVIDRASIKVEDDMSNPSDRTSCNMELRYANVSNVPIKSINTPLYRVWGCNFSAKRSLFEDGFQKVLLDIRLTDQSIVMAPYNPPSAFPIREIVKLFGCDFFDEDGVIEKDRGTFNYEFTGLKLHQMKRALVSSGDFDYLMNGVESTRCDSLAVETSDFHTGDWGVVDNESILRICSNTFDKVEFGNQLNSSNSSWIFANTHNQTATAISAYNSPSSHHLRGNTFEDYRDFGLMLHQASARLDIESIGRNVPIYSLWGRNTFMYNGNGTDFGARQNADIGMLRPIGAATLPCGYNQFAEKTTWHLYSKFPKINYPVRFNEFLDPTGHAVRTFNVAWVGAPINTSATLPGCGNITGEYCTQNPEAPYGGGLDPYYISDGGWVDIPWNDPYLNNAFWHSRVEMFDSTISTEGRLVKMYNALEAALLGDSIESTLQLLSNDYQMLATDPLSPVPLQASAFFLQGEVQERLGVDSLATLAYTEVTTNYANEPDSITASWRLQVLEAKQLDPTFGALFDSISYAARIQMLTDVRRISQVLGGSPKPVIQGARGSEAVAGELNSGSRETAVLGQNVPNPVEGQTVIPYELSREAKVRLTVTNSVGEEIAVLVDGVVSAGEHITVFTTTGIPVGRYFYHLEIGGSRETRSLLIQK
ncbi:MAG: S8 family serine peptidase [Candidatus Kapaibacterium sp.]